MLIMSKQASLTSFFKKPVVVNNDTNEMTETINSNEQEIEIDKRSRKKVKTSINYTYKYIDKYISYGFTYINENEFWISLSNEYPDLCQEALKKLVPFATTYLCESGFSTLTTIKTKSRNKLDVEPTMRVSLTNSIKPRIDFLVKKHQEQGSH